MTRSFSEYPKPKGATSWDDVYDALIAAHKRGNALRVRLKGIGRDAVTAALRRRHLDARTLITSRVIEHGRAVVVALDPPYAW